MKRVLDDPVLAQLDFLINGPPKAARTEEAPAEKEEAPPPPPPPPPPLPLPLAPNPVLAQLDALINGAPTAAAAPPPLLAPLAPVVVNDDDDVRRGPPGILREFGGVRGWMARHAATSPTRSTPPPSGVRRNSPSDQTS